MIKSKAAQNTRKRPAPSQDGPPTKKSHLQPPKKSSQRPKPDPARSDVEKTSSKKVKEDDEGARGKKRALPVTDTREEGVPRNDEGSDNDSDGVDSERSEDEMNVDGREEYVPTKTNHESHATQRALLASRRAAKPHAGLLLEAKRIWAQARQNDHERRNEGTSSSGIGKAERRAYVTQLMDLVRGHIQELVLKHDASRIMQTIVKYGTAAQRLEVAKELEGHYLSLVQGKYSKFLVSKLIRYSPSARPLILAQLVPEVPRLLHHAYASPVLADAYELYCTGSERSQLLRAFWGREAALFRDGVSEKSKNAPKKKNDVEAPDMKDVDSTVPSESGLKGVLTSSSDIERRKRTLAAVRENLLGVFNNPSPVAARHSVTHRALWEYLEALGSTEIFTTDAFPDQERERAWREVYESCQDQLSEMVHTREGSRSVREFIARGTAKDRKQIVKVLRPHIARIAQNDDAQLVLFTALDVIDDTKLVAKQLIDGLLPDPPTSTLPADLLKNTAGRRTLVYLLVPRNPRHFTPALISTLAATDGLRATTSKKDPKVRADEIRRAASPALLALITDRGVALSRDPKGSLLVAEIMLFAEGDRHAAQEALLRPLAAPYPATDDANPHAIDIPHTSRLYKTLLQGGHYDRASGRLSYVPTFNAKAFATAFVRITGRENILGMACGNGAFVIAELCARLCIEGDAVIRSDLRAWFSAEVRSQIGQSSIKGRDVLLEKLKELDITN